MLKSSIKAVLEDKQFQLLFPAAKEACVAASKINDWLASNGDLATPLAQELVDQLSNCIHSKKEMWSLLEIQQNLFHCGGM